MSNKGITEQEQKILFGKNLKHWLTIRGVKQVELAKELGVSESAVAQWISGRTMPKMGKIQRISDMLEINKSDLLEEKDDFGQEMLDDEKTLFDDYRHLSSEGKKTARNLVKTLRAQEEDND